MAASSSVPIKQEALDYTDIENRILELCKDNPKGISDANVTSALAGVETKQRVTAINRLLSSGNLEVLKNGNTLFYRWKDSQSAQKTKGFEQEEKLIYQIIENSGNIGIWARDMRYKSNLPITQVNKIVKVLEGKKLIKAVNSVAAGKKKVYMLYNTVPDSSVTGGAWYSDQDFEAEFVDILNQQCNKFLSDKRQQAQELPGDPLLKRHRSWCTSAEVWKYISELGISNVSLSVHDIETILSTLIFDGKAEMSVIVDARATGSDTEQASKKLYRSINQLLPVPGLMRVPCGVCPVIADCTPGGKVSPEACTYMKEWLDF